jgi:hypothetical protein
MRYRIIFYDRTTDRVAGLINIPGQLLPRVLTIAGIRNVSELGEYPLAPKKVGDIAALIGFEPDVSRFEYHLEPLEDPARA